MIESSLLGIGVGTVFLWLVLRELVKILHELKNIATTLSALEERSRPRMPASIEEWQRQRGDK